MAVKKRTFYVHLKTNEIYEFQFEGKDEETGNKICIYRSLTTGIYWSRRWSEFFDGRFKEITLYGLPK